MPGSLAGRVVALTRPADRGGGMVARLEAAGAEVLVAPAIEVAAAEDPAPLDAALSGAPFDLAVFTSVNAVRFTFGRLAALGRALRATRLAAVGEATAEALRAEGREPDVVPEEATAEGLLAALDAELAGRRVFLPRANRGRDTFPAGARARGAEVTAPVAYRTILRPEAGRSLRPRLEAGTVDAIVFFSPSAVRAVGEGLGADGPALLRRTLVAAIGPTTAAALEAAGLEAACPERIDADAVVDLLVARLGR